jgi:hypothetical protein
MASSSSAAATSFSYPGYDVFINYGGPDIKKTFASHLYRRLLSHGLRTFLDREELQVGDTLSSQIQEAIATASVHVAIFYPRYAESSWVLEELVLMVQSRAVILPVFYNVRPSELRRTKDKDGMYAPAFRSHEKKNLYNSARIEEWRKALSHVSAITGFDLNACNGDERELLEEVVTCVLKVVSKPVPLSVAKYPSSSTSEIPGKSALLHSSSASPVSTLISNYRYDVFINHAPELKKTFANHLYCRLVFYGMQPFQESEEMEKGDNLSTEIEEAIATASVHVAIFSRTYAESHLCLDELLLMVESGAPVFPVFYNVEPLQLQRTKVKDGVYSPDTIENWRIALDRISQQTNRLELKKFEG